MFQRVLIAGIGALGSEVAKNLGLLGCKSVYLADADAIEPRNVGRSLFTTAPTTIGRTKIAQALEKLRTWFPLTQWNGVPLEIADLAPEDISKAEVLFSCVDTDLARTEIAALSVRYKVPVCDGGLGGTSTRVGRVSWFPAKQSSACFACLLAASRRAALLSLWESDVHACWARSLSGDNTGWTTTPGMASIVAGLQVETAASGMEKRHVESYSLQLDLDRATAIEKVDHRQSISCPFHEEISGELFPICTLAACNACGNHYSPNVRIGWLRRWSSCPFCGSRDLLVRQSLSREPMGWQS